MYRKRARAAHVLHPTTDSTAASAPVAPVQANPAVGPTSLGNVPGAGYNQQPQVSATPQMQFFNPMTYQNGFASGTDPQQFPGAQPQSQQVGVAGGVQNAAPPPQQGYNYGGEQLNDQQSTNQQGSYDYQGNWQGQQQEQTSQEPTQNINQDFVANKQVAADQQGWQQPVADSQQAWQQQGNAATQQQQDNQAFAEQQQTNDVAKQQPQQNGEVNQEQQQQLELILDPSGQWCWDYYAQQWVPYSADQQQGNNQPDQQSEGDKALIDHRESTPSEAVSNTQGMVYQQEGVGAVGDDLLGGNVQQQLQDLPSRPPSNNLQDLVNGIGNLEIAQDATGLAMSGSTHFQPPTENALPPTDHIPPPSEHILPPTEHIPPSTEHIPPPTEHIPPPTEHAPPPTEHGHGLMHQQSQESDHNNPLSGRSGGQQELYPPQHYYQPSNQEVPRQPSVESQPFSNEIGPQEVASNGDNSAQDDAYHGQASALVGPPDLVDMRQYNQPEIVNDVNNYAAPSMDNKSAPPPPDMFASLPISSYTYSGGVGGALHPPPPGIDTNRNSNDYAEGVGAHASNMNPPPQMDLQMQSVAPDLTAQSIIQQSMANSNEQANNPGNSSASDSPMYGSGGASGGALAHDQHHDFYKDQIESAMPDLTSGQRSSWDANSNRVSHPPRRASQDKAPDILRTEPLVVPSTDRNLYMETGELQEEDAHRVAHEIPGSLQPSLLQPVLLPTVSAAANKSAQSNLPPMVGGNEPPMLGSAASEPPSLIRMVVGESVAAPPPSIPPPAMMSIPPTNQRLVEGGSNGSDGAGVQLVPLMPAREIEGEVGSTEPRANMYPDTIDRTIEGEDESSSVPLAPPPVQTREVEGEPQPLPPPPPSTSRLPPPQNAGSRLAPLRGYPGAQSGNQSTPVHDQDYGALSSALSSTPLDSSPIHQVSGGMPHQINSTASLSPNTEVRSAAAGSDKRDETVMGGPPPPVKAPPLPTPGRAVAGQEATGVQSQPGYPPAARRRGDDYKKSTYDSDDDNIPESESERNDVQKRRIQPRRNLSPKGNRTAGRPVRGYDRLNRSSTDRDDDSDRKHDFSRDDDDYYNGSKTLRNHDRRSNRRDHDRRHNVDDRDDDRRSIHGGREDDRRSQYGRDDDRRSLHGRDREEDRRSYQGGGGRRREQGGRYRDVREESYYRRGRVDSELDRESFYGDDHPNRPGSRAGSVSHYDATMNESMFSRVGGGGGGGMAGGMAFYPQLLQQQYQYQMQYQIQTAVQEMEKSLTNPEHVKTYKAYWDTYGKQPQLMEKLRLENPILHHLLIHFQRNFLHLIEDKKAAGVTSALKEGVAAGGKVLGVGQGDPEDQEVEDFARKFHQLSPSHRPESREAGLESTIAGPQDSVLEHTSSASIQPARLTPLMFSRPHVCARVSASGLLIKVDAHSPREGQSATVELHSVASLLQHTQEYRELTIFPGPLKPKETHRNDVIKFCERKMADARDRRMVDRESYELIWRMLILLLRQKGQVEGSDLADLLITDKKNRMDTSMDALSADRSRGGSSYRGQIDAEETASMSSISEEPGERTDRTMSSKTFINSGASQEEYVAKFRSYLLHGNKTEGLEFAMNAGLWGHALFLASKMDQRTYATVMTRFANGLAVNDPLQTLYQLMSARIPAAMKNFADQRLGDWRPHLAMILSNPYPGSDINRRSMKTLGDTLLSKGQIYAAQFCYIVSGMEFGNYSNKTSKLVLLLSMPGEKSVDEFATNEAIQCTEIYEFVQKLGSPEYEMPTLQPYKFLHAIRLVECGLTNQAQAYCREIAEYVINNPNNIVTDFLPEFLQQLETLSDRLKYQDPQYTTSSGELSEIPDPEWMGKLREAVHNITYAAMYGTQPAETAADTNSSSEPQSGYYDQSQYQASAEYTAGQQEQQPAATQEATQQQDYDQPASYEAVDHSASNNNEYGVVDAAAPVDPTGQVYGYHQSNGWSNGNMQTIPEQQPQEAAYGENGTYPPASNDQQPPPTMFNPESYNSGNVNLQQDVMDPGQSDQTNLQPTTNSVMTPMFNPADIPSYANNMPLSDISNPGSRKTSITEPQFRKKSLASNDIVQDNNANNEMTSTKASPTKAKTNEKSSKSEQPVKKSSWLPGFIGKILNPPNQVHLPDDSNKTIYYDDKLGRWVNTDADEDSSAPAAPPPMDSAFMNKSKDSSAFAPPGASSLSAPNSVPSSPSEGISPGGSTSFRVAKRRGRAAYVDVNKQSGLVKPISGDAGMPPMMMAAPSDQAQPTSLPPMMFNPGAVEPSSNGPALDEGGPSSLQPDAGGYGGGYEQEAEAAPPIPTGVPMMFNPSSMGSVTAPPTF